MISESKFFKKINWLEASVKILGILSILSLSMNVFIHFFPLDLKLGHDEAEHLRVIFGFDKGLFPFKNYLENHPILPHIVAYYIKNLFEIQSVISLYYLLKFIVFLHFFGCVLLIGRFLNVFREDLGIEIPVSWAILVALGFLSVWDLGKDWIWGLSSIWMIRPDWPANFYVLLAFYLHFKTLKKVEEDPFKGKFVAFLSGASLALSVIILPKFVFLGVPYVLSFVAMSASSVSVWREKLRSHINKYIYAHLWILMGFLAIFIPGIAFELNFLNVSLLDYFNYVYQLNVLKHVLMINIGDDYNPWNILRSIMGVALLPFSILFAFYFGLLSYLSRYKPGSLELGALMMCGFILAFNMLIPAFANGLIFPWYFTYSIVSLIALIVLFTNRIYKLRSPVIKLLIGILICFQVVKKFGEAAHNFKESPQAVCLMNLDSSCFGHLLHEPEFPENVVYFSIFLDKVPVKARLANYYSLGPNLFRLWVDGAALKLGPDPETNFKKIFELDPPTAVVADDFDDFRNLIGRISHVQKINLNWLNEVVRRNYICHTKNSQRLLLLASKTSQFAELGWVPCLPSTLK